MEQSLLLAIVSVLLTAVILKIIAAVTPDLELDNFGTALIAAVVVAAGHWLAFFLWDRLGPSAPLLAWQQFALLFVDNTVAVGLGSLVLADMRFKGLAILIVTGAILTALDSGAQFVLNPLIAGLL